MAGDLEVDALCGGEWKGSTPILPFDPVYSGRIGHNQVPWI
jgi:hypothetical protein